jgi:hypothetical protein
MKLWLFPRLWQVKERLARIYCMGCLYFTQRLLQQGCDRNAGDTSAPDLRESQGT